MNRLIAFSFITVFTIGAMSVEAAAKDPTTVIYDGRLEGAKGQPLGGVYPLTFSLYRTAKSERAVWSESHVVAVHDGRYAVTLGETTPIPKTVSLDRVYLGVGVQSGAELLRERLGEQTTPKAQARTPQAVAEPAAVAPEAAPVAGQAGAGKDGESYAEVAGYAYEAERAKVADKVGTVTAKELAAMVKKGGSRVTIGGAKRFTESIGGTGGQPFTLKCPKGHVVTGIRGNAAALVDSLSLICSPLE